MPGLNEADTCRVHITPALIAAGWGDPHWRIAEQHYFIDRQIVIGIVNEKERNMVISDKPRKINNVFT